MNKNIAVVGAGIAGLTTADFSKERYLKVRVHNKLVGAGNVGIYFQLAKNAFNNIYHNDTEQGGELFTPYKTDNDRF